MLQIQAQFLSCISAAEVALHHMFCHRCASATRSDSVRNPIRFRSPPDQIPSAARSDSVRHPIRFRPPPIGGYGILPYPRSPPRSPLRDPLRDPPCCPHRGCSGLRCTNQTINQPNKQTNTQPPHHLILPIKSSHISNKNTNFANP